jgi:hypothetical protein
MCSEVQKQIQLETEITLSFFFFFFFWFLGGGLRTRKKGTRSLESNQVETRTPRCME